MRSAEDELAKLMSMQVLLDRLGQDEQYADELAALREAVENMDDDETVVNAHRTEPDALSAPRAGGAHVGTPLPGEVHLAATPEAVPSAAGEVSRQGRPARSGSRRESSQHKAGHKPAKPAPKTKRPPKP